MTSIPDGIRALVVALHQIGGGELLRGQAGVRINLASLNVETDAPWEHCFSVDVNAEALARVIKALGGPAGVGPVRGAVPAPAPATEEPSEWSAAAVAHNHSQIYADVQDHLDDVFNSPDAEAALVAYEQLVTGEWDGEL
ncbi:hypothetical protein OHA04_45615 (plasmid) [Streptomyces sp. NBC_01590]|uniref:hypothetical protein n=1 Tax=Streptomyces sp. NBC_01590 TaxID=2975887 RepID=UPI002F9118D1